VIKPGNNSKPSCDECIERIHQVKHCDCSMAKDLALKVNMATVGAIESSMATSEPNGALELGIKFNF